MDKTQLNPPTWRDDERRRMSVTPPAQSGIGSALRASYEVAPLSDDLARLLQRLR